MDPKNCIILRRDCIEIDCLVLWWNNFENWSAAFAEVAAAVQWPSFCTIVHMHCFKSRFLHAVQVYGLYFLTLLTWCADLNENVATLRHGAQVIRGEMKTALLDGDTTNYDLDRGFTRHPIDDSNIHGIVIRLGQPSIINAIRMLLWDRDMRYISMHSTTAHEVIFVSLRSQKQSI